MSEVRPAELPSQRDSSRKLLLLAALCLAPVLASYLSYYVLRPAKRSNYGDLIEPQRPVPDLTLSTLDGRPFELSSLEGKWIMLMTAGGECPQSCQDRLYEMRQVRLTTGKDRDRVERVWLIDDDTPLSTLLIREYDGTHMLRARRDQVEAWLPSADANRGAGDAHIYVIDPHAHLMMRFPRNADPSRVKRDLQRLLAASSIG